MKKCISILSLSALLGALAVAPLLNQKDFSEVSAENADSYIYIVTGHNVSWAGRNIYGFGGDGSTKEFGDWPGKEVTTVEGLTVTSSARFGKDYDTMRNGGIYKLPYHSSSKMTHIIFNSGSGQTANLPLVNGACYLYNGSTTGEARTDLGTAAKTVYDFDAVLGSVSTICSASGAFSGMNDAQKCEAMAPLYSEYLQVIHDGSDDAKGYVNDSKLTSGEHGLQWLATTVFKDVLDRNGYVFNPDGSYSEPSPAKVASFAVSDELPVFAVTIGSVGLLGGLCSFFLLRKRKAE